ncbi:porin [Erythrobacter sp. F6033]|uniref:OprO/OprP family phosphate-selective porin n=1 Tax=Erythrobacter sp. F6033 TaxID=2926401 RepID=UPI001FF63A9D|nr:porin [Erythrobacter sp. F6033]MCK0129551.1 porin [Erythrobacter sp. F6033]
MTRKVSYLLSAGLLAAVAAPASAQEQEALLQELAKMRGEMAQMAERMENLESQLAETKTQTETNAAEVKAVAEAEPSNDASIGFKGAPEIKSEGGWSFKPRGRLQYDAGIVDAPDSTGRDDGFGNDVRRARLGVAGDIPGGFGYKFEVDVANSDLTVTDAIISYETGNVDVQVGQFNNFQGLEELTSSLHTSFIERAAFTDAFNFIRRVGVGVTYGEGDVLVQGGVFTDNMDRLSNQNWSANGRVVYMPKIGDAQLHFGGSAHYRSYEDGNTVRYRQRPLVGFTSERFINTGNMDAESESGFGLEGAVIAGSFHAAIEGRWQNLDMPMVADTANFFGGYAEVGYFLTKGDTRGYKGGKFDRTKPANPVGEGGMGSLQLNVRYDRLDLNDGTVIGGTQDGYFASLVWKPTDYTMLLANYGRLEYGDAVFPTVTGNRDYGVDVFAVRAQIDF